MAMPMTRIMRIFANRIGNSRPASKREAMPRDVAMAALGAPAPEFL